MKKKKKPKKVLICEYCKRTIDEGEKLERCPICKKMLCLYHVDPKEHACEGVDWEKLAEEREKASEDMVKSYLRKKSTQEILKAFGKIVIVLIIAYWLYAFLLSIPSLIPPTNETYEEGQVSITEPSEDISTEEAISYLENVYEREKAIADEINKFRDTGLIYDEELAEVARKHSCDMLERSYFSHVSPEGYEVWDRLEAYNITDWNYSGENIYMSEGHSKDAEYIAMEWMESEQHYENVIFPQYTTTGIGICEEDDLIFVTQVFIG